MKKFVMGLTLMVVLAFCMEANATGGGNSGRCNGVLNCNDVDVELNNAEADARARANAESSSYSSGTGIGVGVGQGGDADSSSYSGVRNSGNSRNYNEAEGGDAYARGGSAHQGQGQQQGQDTDVDASSRNRNSQDTYVDASDNSFESTITAVSSDDDVSISSDDDVTVEGDTYTTTYKVPANAGSGYANSLIVDCQRILGFDFRGSGQTQARGASFGIPLPGGKCELEKAARAAFNLGNHAMGWTLYCAQAAVWKGVRTVNLALTGDRFSKSESIQTCMSTVTINEVAVIDLSQYATKDEVSQKVDRAFTKAMTK